MITFAMVIMKITPTVTIAMYLGSNPPAEVRSVCPAHTYIV